MSVIAYLDSKIKSNQKSLSSPSSFFIVLISGLQFISFHLRSLITARPKFLCAKNQWSLGDPGLIVSVVGDVDGGDSGESFLKNSFKGCLLSVFKDTPNSWVLTDGFHCGIGKYVGEVVKDINLTKNQVQERSENVSITCIGFTHWGSVKNNKHLIDPDSSRRPKQFLQKVKYDVKTKKDCLPFYGLASKEEFLDPNHTHFLLIDDGTVGRVDDKIPFAFRDKIMEIASCPCANLLFGGGLSALDDIIHSLTKEGKTSKSLSSFDDGDDYRTPCIVIKGSGKAADLITLGMQLLQAKRKGENDQEYVTHIVNSKAMVDLIDREFGMSEVKNIRWRLRRCLENHPLIWVFDPDEDEAVNVEVLKAFQRHGVGSKREKFEVAYQWNRIDVAAEIWREMIETGEEVQSDKWVIKALAEGNLGFVQLFLTHACDNGEFLTETQLKSLYQKYTVKSKQKRIKKFLEQDGAIGTNGFESYMKVISNYFVDKRPQEQEFDLASKFYYLPADYNQEFVTSAVNLAVEKEEEQKKTYSQTCADLFVWCIFAGHYDIADWLMKHSRHPTAFGLMAVNILRTTIKFAESKSERQSIEQKAVEFEAFSVSVLCKCYMADPLKAKFVLIQGQEVFHDTSCMELAARDKHCLEFICHPACQTHLNDIWRRSLCKSRSTYNFVTIFSIVLWGQLVMSPHAYDKANASFQSPTLALIVIFFAVFVNFLLILVFAVRGMKKMRKPKKPVNDFKELKGLNATNDFLYSIGIECGYARSSSGFTDCAADAADFFKAPCVKFFLHCTSYGVYLIVYTYFLLFDTHAKFVSESPSSVEVIIYLFWFSYITQEIKQICKNDLSVPLYQTKWKSRYEQVKSNLRLYFNSVWNWYDLILLATTTIICIFRVVLYSSEPGPIHKNGEQYLTLAYSVVFALFLMRLLQFFLVNINLGPKLMMITQMLYDLSYFALFLVIFLFSFSLVSHTMLEALKPDQERRITVDLIANLFRRGFWNLFGETFLEEYQDLYDEASVRNETVHLQLAKSQFHLPTYAELSTKILVPLLQGIYMFVTVILLLNLLIATFTFNITKLQETEIKLWYIFRKEVIFEYFYQPFLPHPFSIIINIKDLFVWLRDLCCPAQFVCCLPRPKVFACRMLCIYVEESLPKRHLGRKILKRIERWEKMMSNSVQESQLAADRSASSYAIGEIRESVRNLTKMQLLEDVGLENLDMKGRMNTLEKSIQKISQQLQRQGEETEKRKEKRCGPCRNNCLACQKLIETDRFFFKDAEDVYFIREKIDCHTSGLIIGVSCSKCHPHKPAVKQIIKGFSIKETPSAIPLGNHPPEGSTSIKSTEFRLNYLKKTFRDMVKETLAMPPDHFHDPDHDPAKHLMFVGIEVADLQNKNDVPARVKFWEQKC